MTGAFRRAASHYSAAMRRRLGVAIAAAVLAVSLAGCGGPMTPGELSRSIDTLASTAAEGAMLAGDVADDRTKATFARVHARDMSDVVVHEAEKLNDADAEESDVAAAKTRAIDLADKIDTALGQIQVAPDDEPGARQAATQLDGLSKQASDLSEGL
jgi:hypothetical protein